MFIASVLGGVAVLMFVIALVIVVGVRRERTGGVRVTGEVIGHGTYTSRGRTMYFPMFRATLHDGRTIEGSATTAMATSWPSPKLGAHRGLVHHPGKEPAFSQLSFVPFLPAAILGGLGVGFTVAAVGIAMAIHHHR